MVKLKAWIQAARLRTLPLSLSGIIMGTALANERGHFNTILFVLALLTAIAFQLTSNFANDYGDGTKGTDDAQRIGPKRALQSGTLSGRELKIGIWVMGLISLLMAIGLIWVSFGYVNGSYFIFFIILALFSIWAALKYTMGSSPYGYNGFGDIFVLFFFGLVAVLGTEFLYSKRLLMVNFLPAFSIGLLSVGVLNLNNLRDVDSDRRHGKNTLVVKMGFENGKVYHVILLITAIVVMLWYSYLTHKKLFGLTYMISLFAIPTQIVKIVKTKNPKAIDPELRKLALSTFLLSLLFYLSVNYFF